MIDKLLQPEVQKFIMDHQFDDPFVLSLKSKKGAPVSPVGTGFPLKQAIEQIQSLQKARNKIPSWVNAENVIWPPPISIEQSSSELAAKFKANSIHGKTMVDLTGGMGVDASFFADSFEEVHYVENNPQLVELAKHNFKTLGKNNITVHNSSAEKFVEYRTEKIDAIFIDPSRRLNDKKVFKLEDCSPNVYSVVPSCLKFTNQLLIKLSPLVDLSLLIKDFSPVNIWVISIKNEVKEVLCLIQHEKSTAQIMAIDLKTGGEKSLFEFKQEEEVKTENVFSLPLKYIYEPSAGILKAGAFKLIGHRFGLYKLQVNSHLYTSDELKIDFPGRIFLLKALIRKDKKAIARVVPNKKVNVLTRNYPLSPDRLKKKLSLKDGGEHFLIGTTLMDGKKALLLCERV